MCAFIPPIPHGAPAQQAATAARELAPLLTRVAHASAPAAVPRARPLARRPPRLPGPSCRHSVFPRTCTRLLSLPRRAHAPAPRHARARPLARYPASLAERSGPPGGSISSAEQPPHPFCRDLRRAFHPGHDSPRSSESLYKRRPAPLEP